MLQFTLEEQRLIASYTRDRGPRDWMSFYVAVLVAPIGFALYGMVKGDVIAMAVAFFGLLALVAWGVSSAIRDWRLVKAICVKLSVTLPNTASIAEPSRG
jgi:hypothetical protein